MIKLPSCTIYYILSLHKILDALIFHAREAVKIEKNLENLVTLLSFYGLLEHLMDDEEAEKVAKEILELDSNNETAISVLNEILNSKKNK